MFELKKLPYEKTALQPVIWKDTIDVHYDKHHQTYVDNLNKLVELLDIQFKPLEEVIKEAYKNPEYKAIYNNAAQVWNHDFFWSSMQEATNEPVIPEDIKVEIEKAFGSIDEFRDKFKEIALKHFGSGWAWLVFDKTEKILKLISTSNADTPLTDSNLKPILTIDVWEHSYYIDYQNKRMEYLEGLVKYLLNFEFASENLKKEW